MARVPITISEEKKNDVINLQNLAEYDAKIKDWVEENTSVSTFYLTKNADNSLSLCWEENDI